MVNELSTTLHAIEVVSGKWVQGYQRINCAAVVLQKGLQVNGGILEDEYGWLMLSLTT
jgi:hypothetical protein